MKGIFSVDVGINPEVATLWYVHIHYTHTGKFVLSLTKMVFKMMRKLDTLTHLKEIIILFSVAIFEHMKILGYYTFLLTSHCQISREEIKKKGHNLDLILCSKRMFSFKLLWHALHWAHLRGRVAVRWSEVKRRVCVRGGWADWGTGHSECRLQAPAELCPSAEIVHSDGSWLKLQRTKAHGQYGFVSDRGQST